MTLQICAVGNETQRGQSIIVILNAVIKLHERDRAGEVSAMLKRVVTARAALLSSDANL